MNSKNNNKQEGPNYMYPSNFDLNNQEHDKMYGVCKGSNCSYQEIVEMLPEAVFKADADFNLIYANQHALNLFGYSEQDIKDGLNGLSMLIAKDRKRAINFFAERLTGSMPGATEYTALRKDGSTFPIIFHANSLFSEGKLIGLIGVIFDNTKRKETENNLRKNELLLIETQKIASLGTYVLDIKKGTWVSSVILNDIYGINETITKDIQLWSKLLYSVDQDAMETYFQQNVLTDHELFNKQYRIRRLNDGQVRWVNGLGKLEFDKHGNPSRMIGTIQDITDMKLAELEIQNYQLKLEELVAERTAELRESNNELSRYNKLFEGREFRIKELRTKVKELEEKLATR